MRKAPRKKNKKQRIDVYAWICTEQYQKWTAAEVYHYDLHPKNAAMVDTFICVDYDEYVHVGFFTGENDEVLPDVVFISGVRPVDMECYRLDEYIDRALNDLHEDGYKIGFAS